MILFAYPLALFLLLAAPPLQAAQSASDDADLLLLRQRRTVDLASFPSASMVDSLPVYLSTQEVDGTWSDVNYDSGCQGRQSHVLLAKY